EWGSILHQALIHEKGLESAHLSALKKFVNSELIPHLTTEESNMIQMLLSKNSASTVPELVNVLQTYSNHHTYQYIQHVLEMVKGESLISLPPQEKFLQHINDWFVTGIGKYHSPHQTSGHDQTYQTQTMKSLLIQLLQNSDGTVHAKAKQFAHFLNG